MAFTADRCALTGSSPPSNEHSLQWTLSASLVASFAELDAAEALDALDAWEAPVKPVATDPDSELSELALIFRRRSVSMAQRLDGGCACTASVRICFIKAFANSNPPTAGEHNSHTRLPHPDLLSRHPLGFYGWR